VAPWFIIAPTTQTHAKPLKMKKKEYTPPIFVGQNLYIRPSYIVSMPEFDYDCRYSSLKFEENQNNLKTNRHNGKLSKKAISGLRNAVNWLVLSAKPKRVYSKKSQRKFLFKISFITLTLPDTSCLVSSDKFQTALVNPFLVYLRKYCHLKNYVWKMEFQKNGKLHIHLTLDCFIHHAEIRRIWNMQLKREGLLTDFKQKFGHDNPNSTDVHSVRKVRDIASYMAKYMTKQSADLVNLKGRIWGCSYELSKANKTKVHVPSSECYEELKSLMSEKIDWVPLTVQKNEYSEPRRIGEIFYLRARDWIENITGTVKATFQQTINNLTSAAQFFTDAEFYTV